MIRQFTETVHEPPTRNGHDETMVDVFAQDMEIDDSTNSATDWEKMDVEDEYGGVGVGTGGPVKSALDAVEYGRQLGKEFRSDTRPEIRKALEEAFSLLAYTDPKNSVLAHLLDEKGRVSVAEELNSAILGKVTLTRHLEAKIIDRSFIVSLGKSSVAALERLVQQSTVLIHEISEDGGPGAFVNLRNDYLKY